MIYRYRRQNWVKGCFFISRFMYFINKKNSFTSAWKYLLNFFQQWFCTNCNMVTHFDELDDDVIKWKHFPRYWPFVRGIHRSPVNSPHKGKWRGALMFSLICVRINGWVNNGEASDLRCHRARCDAIVMCSFMTWMPHHQISLHVTDTILKCIFVN